MGGEGLGSMGQGHCGPGGTEVRWSGPGKWREPVGASDHHRQGGGDQECVGPLIRGSSGHGYPRMCLQTTIFQDKIKNCSTYPPRRIVGQKALGLAQL